MPYDYSAIMTAQWERIEAEASATAAQLEAARVTEDADGVHSAAQRLLELDAQRAALAQRANQYVAQQQQSQTYQQQNKYGLSPQEVEVARNSFGPIKRNGRMVDMTDDEKLQTYAQNRHKYRTMIANGTYSNDQGSVRR